MIRSSQPLHRPAAQTATTFTLRWGLLSGLIAGALMVFVTLAIRLAWDVSSITELAADWLTATLPGRVVDWLLETLSFRAKPLMFTGLLISQTLVGAGVGMAYARLATYRPVAAGDEWRRALLVGMALWLVSMVTVVPGFGGGFFATDVIGSSTSFIFTSLSAFLTYSLVLGFMFAVAGRSSTTEDRGSRRAFLKRAVIWAVAAGVGAYGVRFLFNQASEQMASSGSHRLRGALSTEVTPNDQFYTVSKNFIDPEVRLSEWSLTIEGLVENPKTFEFDELRALPYVEKYVTLECISNVVGGDLISNALWRGVPLKTLLDEAEIAPEARDVSFWAWDGYSESISLDKLMRDEVMVVYEMNGEPLPHSHGFPVRLIVPGFFGLKSVKWLGKIEPVDFDFTGYWQGRGWTDLPLVKTMSRIDTPAPNARRFMVPLEVGGVAFAGARGIQRVEIKTEDTDWTPAEQISEPLSPYTWVIWRTTLEPAAAGRTKLRVRAIDGDGNLQTEERAATIPDGATGYHEIDLVFERG